MGLCQNPTFIKGLILPCGQCMACRLQRKRVWTHRVMLEASLHSLNAFVTLTYSDEHLPGGGSLNPEHLRLFWMRLRKDQAQYGRKLRYFANGEYGSDTERPHYHAIIFGMPSCYHGRTRHYRFKAGFNCCNTCDAVARCWPHGGIDLGQVERASAAYVCGYVTKKLTDPDDYRLGGRHPEFSRVSKQNGGLGARYIPEVASKLLELPPKFLAALPDVPTALRHRGKPWPLGRYLTRKLREQIGRSPDAPQSVLDDRKAEVQLLRRYAEENISRYITFSQVYKSLCLEINAPAFNVLANRQQYRKHRYTL